MIQCHGFFFGWKLKSNVKDYVNAKREEFWNERINLTHLTLKWRLFCLLSQNTKEVSLDCNFGNPNVKKKKQDRMNAYKMRILLVDFNLKLYNVLYNDNETFPLPKSLMTCHFCIETLPWFPNIQVEGIKYFVMKYFISSMFSLSYSQLV